MADGLRLVTPALPLTLKTPGDCNSNGAAPILGVDGAAAAVAGAAMERSNGAAQGERDK